MNTRRDFLKLGALFVPAIIVPPRAYSFLWSRGAANGVGAGAMLVWMGEHQGFVWSMMRAQALREFERRDREKFMLRGGRGGI